MKNFQFWFNEVADIPTRDEQGNWVDLETGHYYDPKINYSGKETSRSSLSLAGLDYRSIAKAFGGKALKGTMKQKEWAEKIRAEKLKDMPHEIAEMVCDPDGILTHSKFWIENRNASASDIGDFIANQKSMLRQYRAAHAKNDADTVKSISEKYNELTAKWGFK